jgi:hypothetical protein
MSESDVYEVSVSGNSLQSSSKNYSSHEDDGSGSSTTGTSLGGQKGGSTQEEEIARSEDRAVAYSRALVLGVLLVSASVAGVVTWIVSTQAEEDDFHTQVRPACSFSRKLVGPNSINWSSLLLMFNCSSV